MRLEFQSIKTSCRLSVTCSKYAGTDTLGKFCHPEQVPHSTVWPAQFPLRFLLQDHEFLPSPAQAFHHFLRSLRQKLFVPQLPLIVGQLFFDLLQFLLQSLTLGGYVDLSFIDHMNVEACRAPRTSPIRQ